jgi:hypothetical protein
MWTWPIWVMSRRRVLEVVFILLDPPSPSRRIFIGSHSFPHLWFAVSVLHKTLGIIGTPHKESIAMILSTKTCQIKRNRSTPAKTSSNLRTPKTPKSSPLTHGFGRGITGQRTTKGSHKFPPTNPQEKGHENTPRKPTREGSENHHQEQPGTTQQSLDESRRIIYTYLGGSYKV